MIDWFMASSVANTALYMNTFEFALFKVSFVGQVMHFETSL